MSKDAAPPRRGAWAGVLAVAVGHLAVDACAGIWPVYKVLAHLDLRAAGGIATAGTLAGNGLQLAFGPLADRGRRRLLIALGVVASGAVCFYPWAGSAGPLTALVLVASAGSAAFHPSGAGYAGGARTGRPGLAVALFLAGGYLGFAASQLAYAAALRALGGGIALLFAAPLLLGAALLLAGRGGDLAGGPGEARPPRPPARSSSEPAAEPRSISGARWRAGPASSGWASARFYPWGKLAVLFAIQALSAYVGVAVQFLTPELFGGAGSLAMGGAHALATLAGAAALFPAGAARDRLGARGVLFGANALAGLSLALLAAFGSRGRGAALAAVLAFTFANAANTVVALAEGTAGLSRAGSSVSALLMGLPWLAAAPAPSVAAFLAHPARGGTPAAALAWMALCSPAAAALALLLPGPRTLLSRPPTTAARPAPSEAADSGAASPGTPGRSSS